MALLPVQSPMGSVFHLSSSLYKKNPCKGAWYHLSVWEDSPVTPQRELVQILKSVYQDQCCATPRVISALCQTHFFTATWTSSISHMKIVTTTGSGIAGHQILLQFMPWDHVCNVLHQNFSSWHLYINGGILPVWFYSLLRNSIFCFPSQNYFMFFSSSFSFMLLYWFSLGFCWVGFVWVFLWFWLLVSWFFFPSQ